MVDLLCWLEEDEAGAVTLEYVAIAVIMAGTTMAAMQYFRNDAINNGLKKFSIDAGPTVIGP
jgi:Flp pilus assembly pilin Flp